jgi:hypothetical protein
MRLETNKDRGHPCGCRLLGAALCVLLTIPACTFEVDLFSLKEGRIAAGGAGAPNGPNSSPNSPTILLEPGAMPVNGDANCQAGHYVGEFSGTYNSAAWGNGAVALMIAATPSLDRPGLEFWLERIPRNCSSDAEFCADFIVRGGKIRGFANPFSDNADSSGASTTSPVVIAVPFEIDFGGDLDCSNGLFRGSLDMGCYSVATVLFRFAGSAPGYYDAATASFTNGTWTVSEQPSADAWFPPDADIGGTGSWQASLANDTKGPAAQSPGLCTAAP